MPNMDSTPLLDWEQEDGRNDPEQRYAIYKVCPGNEREKVLVFTTGTEAGVGVGLILNAREGMFVEDGQPCRIGILDRQGEKGKRWLVLPWEASPRNASDAGRLLQRRKSTTSQA